MKFFHKNRPDGTGYPVPISPQKPRNYIKSDTYGSLLQDHQYSLSNQDLPETVKPIVKALADGYNQVEHASVQEYGVFDRTLELLAMMDSRHETVKEFEAAFNKAIDAMSSLEDILAHITRENYGKGLHVHKMTKKIGDVEQKVAKVWDLMSKSGEKIEQHYPQIYAKWQDTMQLQAKINKEISDVKQQFQDLLLGDATVSLGVPSL